MIIGNGLLANSFKNSLFNHENYLIFASGVSNSNQKNQFEFEREKELLKKVSFLNQEKTLIYFSSTSLHTMNNEYIKHKKEVEDFIENNINDYFIFRLPQIIGFNGNPYNLINFIVNTIKNSDELNIYNDTLRSIIDVVDIHNIIVKILMMQKSEKVYDIAKIQALEVIKIVMIIEEILYKKAKINLLPKQIDCYLNNHFIVDRIIDDLKIKTDNYTQNTIKKYVKHKRDY